MTVFVFVFAVEIESLCAAALWRVCVDFVCLCVKMLSCLRFCLALRVLFVVVDQWGYLAGGGSVWVQVTSIYFSVDV